MMNPMLCLSCLIPGKAGVIIRKISTLLFCVGLCYVVCWVIIAKGLNFKMQSADLVDQNLVLNILVENNSFGSINLKDLNFYNDEDQLIPKRTADLPMLIEKFSSKPLKLTSKLDEFRFVELTIKILGLQKKFKTKVNKQN